MRKVTLNIYDKDRKETKAVDAVMFDKTDYYGLSVYAELEQVDGKDEVIHIVEDLGYMYANKYYPVKRYAIVGVIIN